MKIKTQTALTWWGILICLGVFWLVIGLIVDHIIRSYS